MSNMNPGPQKFRDRYVIQMHSIGFVIFFCMLVAAFVVPPERGLRVERQGTDASSDLTILIDSRTGCQYISDRAGGISPRLGFDGRQMCSGENNPDISTKVLYF